MTTISNHTTPIILAQALDAVSSTEKLPVGTVVATNDGGQAMYVQTMSAISTGNAVVIDVDHRVSNLTTTNAGTISKQVAWAQTSIAVSVYGWVQLSGRPIGKKAADCQDRVILFTTATAGVVDDITVSEALIAGVVAKTSSTTATLGTLIVGPQGAFIHPHANPA
jgi:hypothetical protein